jgi:predicted nucleic acid-binding protein
VLVVDTSAVLGALVGRPPDRRLVDRLSGGGDLCAPHLLDVELRHDLTADDATFVALAELLGVPLVTCDARLANAPGNRATIELYQGAGG